MLEGEGEIPEVGVKVGGGFIFWKVRREEGGVARAEGGVHGCERGAALAALGGAVLAASKGFVVLVSKPVAGGVDDFGEVNDCRASNADDTAPRASSMAELRQMPRCCGL